MASLCFGFLQLCALAPFGLDTRSRHKIQLEFRPPLLSYITRLWMLCNIHTRYTKSVHRAKWPRPPQTKWIAPSPRLDSTQLNAVPNSFLKLSLLLLTRPLARASLCLCMSKFPSCLFLFALRLFVCLYYSDCSRMRAQLMQLMMDRAIRVLLLFSRARTHTHTQKPLFHCFICFV